MKPPIVVLGFNRYFYLEKVLQSKAIEQEREIAKDVLEKWMSKRTDHLAATAEDVRAAYRLMLGRLPESEEVVQSRVGMSIIDLRRLVLNSGEFRSNNKKSVEIIAARERTRSSGV
jgi:hypothetical protein